MTSTNGITYEYSHRKTNKQSDWKIQKTGKAVRTKNVFQPTKNEDSRLFNLKADGENSKSFSKKYSVPTSLKLKDICVTSRQFSPAKFSKENLPQGSQHTNVYKLTFRMRNSPQYTKGVVSQDQDT